MVRVWIMLVRVRHQLVMMNMCMSGAMCNGIRVIVQVMFIVGVFMLVIHWGHVCANEHAFRSNEATTREP
jgi:hypothetical protein